MKNISLLIFLLFFLSGIGLSQNSWTESTFNDFIDGSFDDGGANMYVSNKGNIQTVNRWDVNKDGAIDILCVNSHALVEMLDMSIYWGNGKDYSIQNHSYIPANGPMWVTSDDLNGDGELDLVVANYSNGTWTNMESFVYYGGLEKDSEKEADWGHYPFEKRIKLESSNAQKAAIADLNNDGYKDIVFAFSAGFWEYRDKSKEGTSPSRIYWGGPEDFKTEKHTEIATVGATDVAIYDFNNDDWPDLAFANGTGEYSFIYFGSPDGYNEENLTKLKTNKAHAVEIGDLNNDGYFDLVFANEKGDWSYAYFNDKGKFDNESNISFETHTAKDIAIQDFNKDGFTDVFFTNHQYSLTGNPNLANRLINSYLYYGSENGLSLNNRLSLQTIGAWGTNSADLNNDGWIDLLVCNFQEHYSYEVPSFIYWNGPEGFKQTNRTPLYEHGAQGNEIADFDGDGNLDIVITSMMGNNRGGYQNSYLYYGDQNGSFDSKNMIELPGREAYEQAFTDLDDDGDTDILLINRGEVTRLANEVWIYWNENNEFSTWNMSGLPSYNGLGVQVGDLDKNGFLDIIVSNGNPKNLPDKTSEGSFIYWGSENGWAVYDRTRLPIELTRSATICDINYDGHLDLIFGNQSKGELATIFFGTGERNYSIENSIQLEKSNGTGMPGVGDFNKDGLLDVAFAHNKNILIYYQNEDYSFMDPQAVSIQAKTMTVGDANNDGWLDLVCPYYKGNGKRSWYSSILLGGPNGFSLSNKIELPTDGGTGSLIADFNRDGFNDVFFYCHRKDGSFDEVKNYGDHHTSSILYWGSSKGFSNDNTNKLPNVGVHYDMGVDVGNIWNRENTYSYFSSPYALNGKTPISLVWKAEIAQKSNLKFQIRFADTKEELYNTRWRGPNSADEFFTNNQKIENVNGEWIQYRAIFDTENGAISPVLKEVTINFK